MKNFLVLLFYLTGPIASVYSFIENIPLHPWLFTTHMQRLQPKHLAMIPRPIHRQDVSKFFYWKHLLELECFKELCGHIKDRSGHKRPIETTKHRQMPAFRNDGAGHHDHIPSIFKVKENQPQPELQYKKKYSGNERIILWPPERNFTEKQSDFFPTKQGFERGKTPEYTSHLETPDRFRGNLKESTPVRDFIHKKTNYGFPADSLIRTTQPQDAFGNSRAFPENDSPRKIVPGNNLSPELFQNLGVIRSSTATYSGGMPYGFRHRVHPSRVQPYEVEEIVEEKFLVDVDDDDKDESSFKSVADSAGMDIRTNEMAKPEHFQSVIDSSVNKILKGLISPVIKLPSDKDVRPPEKHERHHGWRQQTEEVPQKSSKRLFKPDARVDNSRGFDLSPSFGKEYTKSRLLTDPPKRPGVTEASDQIPYKIFNTDQFHSDLTDDSRRRSMSVPENIPELPPIQALTGMDLLRKLMADPLPNFTSTEEAAATTTSSGSPSTHSLPPSTTFESAEEILPTTEFTTTDSKDSITILSEAGLTTTDSKDSRTILSGAELTTTDSKDSRTILSGAELTTTDSKDSRTILSGAELTTTDSKDSRTIVSGAELTTTNSKDSRTILSGAELTTTDSKDSRTLLSGAELTTTDSKDSRTILSGAELTTTDSKDSRTILSGAELTTTDSKDSRTILSEAELTTTDSKDSRTILSGAGLTTQDFLETVNYFPEDDVAETEHNFIEFSDHPISFNLLTTTIKLDSEKDQDTIWKSSRRMHFGHEPPRTTVSNGISSGFFGEGQQRRSDILITDNLADYIDDDNKLSTLSYLERLKQDNALLPSDPRNLTLDALIPFIPVVINDLREDKIPPGDIPMLSRALGKYWNSVLALSNFTNLDMLPLVKMKNQNDLENVLQNFLPEDKSSTTVGTTESESRTHDDYSQSYDYLDEYKDLYKDILDQNLGDRKRRFRPRRDADDPLTLEATREYFDSIEQERRDEGSDYIFEDIVYDEVSEGEDESVFELMEVSDVHIDKET